MNTQELNTLIDSTFADHSSPTELPCKSWRVRNPTKSSHWFNITWTPGFLLLSGDVDEMVITHYHAMPTWKEAVLWIDSCDLDYLMEKSDKKKEFNLERTIKDVFYMAEEELENGDDTIWKKIAEGVCFEWDPNNRDDIKREAISYGHEIFSPDAMYQLELFEPVDYTGSYTWPDHCHWQFKALKLWAKMIRNSEEFKEAA